MRLVLASLNRAGGPDIGAVVKDLERLRAGAEAPGEAMDFTKSA